MNRAPLSADRAVVITGIGAVTPLGNDFDSIADALLAGRSGVVEIDGAGFSREARQFAAPVAAIPTVATDSDNAFDRLGQICLAASSAAKADAGLGDLRAGRGPVAGARVGLVLGIGAEQLKRWEADFLAGGGQVFAPDRPASLVHRIAARLGIQGPAVTVAAACASSGYALALARRWIATGLVDVCLAGGCDILSPTGFAAFYNLRALSRRSDDPVRASRPFDRDRDGFVMGEGGAVLVLESRRHADARGARVRGELAGVGMSGDAAHMVIPSDDPTEAARAIHLALQSAGVQPANLDYVNAHAAGTPVGDVAEAAAIRLALGAATDHVPASSTKSMSGHLVSGAAAFEAIACLAAIDRQAIPPTLNLDSPDERCRLDHVPHVARPHPVTVTASNSFGFGGANLCLVIRRAA
jgi:3-oxoacyl-[acyl-carrier-protein] synthase II